MMGKVERIGIGNWKCGSEFIEENPEPEQAQNVAPKASTLFIWR